MIKTTDQQLPPPAIARVPGLSERQAGARARRPARRGADPRVEGRDRRRATSSTVYNFLVADREPARAAAHRAAPTTASCRRAGSRARSSRPICCSRSSTSSASTRRERAAAGRAEAGEVTAIRDPRDRAAQPRERPGRALRRVVAGLHARLRRAASTRRRTTRAAAASSTVAELAAQTRARRVEGLSLSGGEPLQQPEPPRALLAAARALGLSTLAFSGYTIDEIRALPRRRRRARAARRADRRPLRRRRTARDRPARLGEPAHPAA